MRAVWTGLTWLALALSLGVAGLWLFAPREPVAQTGRFDPAILGNDLDRYLAEREAAFADITPGTRKRVIWAGEPGVKTALSLLYVHGFSATSEEIRPVPDRLAEALGANLVFTRLQGHGRSGEAMAEASVPGWLHDLDEALHIARRAGDEIIVIATSTGATLTTIAAQDIAVFDGVKGQIFVSPNFAIKAPAAAILTWPGVHWWGPIVAGAERAFAPQNAGHETYWTTRYPTSALMPMAAAVAHARALDHGSIEHPLLVLFSDEDAVVSAEATREVAAAWGGPVTLAPVALTDGDDPYNHVIAGDILSPGMNETAIAIMLEWIGGL